MAKKWRDVKQNRVQKEEPKKNKKVSKEQTSSCASLPSRLKAFLTDSFLITTPIFYIIIYLVMGSGDDFAQNRVLGWALIVGIHCAIILLFWYIKGQTPGLKAYELRLVNKEKQRVTFIQTVIRYYATLFAIMSLFLIFLPFFNKEKKTFQDIISGTIIIDDQ